MISKQYSKLLFNRINLFNLSIKSFDGLFEIIIVALHPLKLSLFHMGMRLHLDVIILFTFSYAIIFEVLLNHKMSFLLTPLL